MIDQRAFLGTFDIIVEATPDGLPTNALFAAYRKALEAYEAALCKNREDLIAQIAEAIDANQWARPEIAAERIVDIFGADLREIGDWRRA